MSGRAEMASAATDRGPGPTALATALLLDRQLVAASVSTLIGQPAPPQAGLLVEREDVPTGASAFCARGRLRSFWTEEMGAGSTYARDWGGLCERRMGASGMVQPP